jgi:hypothetical protein
VTRLFSASAALVGRLVPKVDADATCGYQDKLCYCYRHRQYWQQCYACSDGSYGCTGCSMRNIDCS